MQQYSKEIEAAMKGFYESLTEKDRRRYAAIEAQKLGHGGISYIERVLGCDSNTINKGIRELSDPEALERKRIREEGGGRKRCLEIIADLEAAFLQVIENHTAGSPMEAKVKWTNLTQQEIADRLREHGIKVSVTVVKQLLEKHNFVPRKAQKRKSSGEFEDRDKQFSKIAQLKAEYLNSANPIISIDTKKKN
jgi:Rhodopirellula transposase DDE domain